MYSVPGKILLPHIRKERKCMGHPGVLIPRDTRSLRRHYMMVKVRVLLVPPLVQPRLLEFPPGVLTATAAVPTSVISELVSVTCSCLLLTIVVGRVAPLKTTTEAETKLLPFKDKTTPLSTSASVTEVGEMELRLGEGRALPHRGLSELQPGSASKVIKRAVPASKGAVGARDTRRRAGR